MTSLVINVPGEYIRLGLVLQSALEQASKGKGRERHASEGEAYEDQIICEVTRRLGPGYPLGQAVKKIYEAQRLGAEKGIAELLGAINYIAASVIVEKEELEAEREEDKRDHEFLNSVFAPYAEKPKAEGCEEPEFKPGDAVEWFSFGRKDAEADGWHLAFYLCKAGDPNYHVVQDKEGMYHVVNYANIRSPEAMYRPGDKVEALSFDGCRWEDAVVERTELLSTGWRCTVRLASGERHCLPVAGSIRRPSRAGDKAKANHPENPDSSPEFKPGDRVQARLGDGVWRDAVVSDKEITCGKLYYTVKVADFNGYYSLQTDDVRPAPKAEGCEALVEKDAPQTPAELYNRIIANNPATFKARTPTGEELAELAEEDAHE